MEQRRTSDRLRTLLEGHVIFNDRSSRVECTVRDISETGARILFDRPVRIPHEFELEVPKKKLCRQVRIMWSDDKVHGVMFIQAPSTPRPADLLRKKPASEDADAPASGVQDILDEARQRIAQLVGRPVEAVRVVLEIDD